VAITETRPPETPPPDHAPGDREMTMLEHLDELRRRLVAAVLAVIVGLLVSIIPIPTVGSISENVMRLIAQRVPSGQLTCLGPGECVFVFLQVALTCGVALAMPMLVYQFLAFVTPALYDNEKKYLFFAVPGVTFAFAAGVAFCYLVMLPVAIAFLGGFYPDLFNQMWSADRTLDFVITFLFWIGVTFELPIIMYFLAKLGVVTPQRLSSWRKYAFVLAFVVGAVVTPTPDPLSQTIVSVPIYLLFELGVIMARFA
jgi:sec-independent protein translocase protein TatC